MPRIYPVVVKRTTVVVGGGDADIVWSEPLKVRDTPTVKPTLPDQLVARDTHRQNPLALHTAPRLTSVRVVPALTAVYPEPLKARSTLIGRVDDLKVGRTGSADTNLAGDGWTDGVPIRNGDNHGNESPLPVAGALLLATTQYAFFKWSLRTPFFVNLSHRTGVGTMRVSLWMSQSLAVAQTIRLTFWTNGSTNPFTESTLNWTNQPAPGGNQVTRSISVLVGATNGRYDVNFTAAETAAYVNSQWMALRMDSDAVLATPVNVVSREGASGERPLLSFDFTRA